MRRPLRRCLAFASSATETCSQSSLPDVSTARSAAARITSEWKPDPLTPRAEWPAFFKKTAVAPVEQPKARYPPLLRRGDVDAGLGAAVRRKVSTYWLPPVAHVPLEPRAAIAAWNGGAVTIHCGVQAPFLVRQEVAQALGVAQSQVRIVAMDSGGAFGGKQRGECEVEAARIARLAGAPIRLAWTREEEFTCSYTRPAALIEVESGVDAEGRLIALRFANYNSGASGLASPYDVPNEWLGFYRTRSDVRQGSYRALAAVANAFARESHVNEWAVDLKRDPVDFRLRHITDARLREVVERTAARFGWGRARSGNGRGFGMSCNLEKDARLALFVEVEAEGARLRVVRMAATGDFGAALNPDYLRNQMTGALIQGIGGALWEQVAFDATSQVTRRLSQYRVPRFIDVPAMDVQIIDRRDVASAGAGESPITLTAPAIAAAAFAATGVRRSELPLNPLVRCVRGSARLSAGLPRRSLGEGRSADGRAFSRRTLTFAFQPRRLIIVPAGAGRKRLLAGCQSLVRTRSPVPVRVGVIATAPQRIPQRTPADARRWPGDPG